MRTSFSIPMTLLWVLISSFVIAQPGGGNMNPEDMAARQTERMGLELALSEEQVSAVYDINLKYAQLTAEARQNSGGDWASMRETMQGMRADKDAELKTVLTEEQFTQHAAMQEQRGPQGRGEGRTGQGRDGEKGDKGKGGKGKGKPKL